MGWLMRFISVSFTCLWIALPASAQDDRGYLQGLLEDTLSDIGREVRITGFAGALSRRATISELSIADGQGIWLRMNDLVLDWDRGALLQGAVRVNELSAGAIELRRLPVSEPGLPSAEAQAFRLPELPVSVVISALRSEQITLGPDVFGMPVMLQLTASVDLAEGDGSAQIVAQRIDGADGAFSVDAGFSNATQVLSIDVALDEAPDGLLATALGIPGRPSVALDLAGNGPIDVDFKANFDLATDGAPRLTGQGSLVALPPPPDEATSAGLGFALTLDGDIAPLFAPQYQRFFGPRVKADIQGARGADGRLDLEVFSLFAQEFQFGGYAQLDADGWPSLLSAQGQIMPSDGARVRLPFGADGVVLAGAELALDYDAGAAESWSFGLNARGVEAPLGTIEALTLAGRGGVDLRDPSARDAVKGQITAAAEGLAMRDPALGLALGAELSAQSAVQWGRGHPLRLDEFMLVSGQDRLTGRAVIEGVAQAVDLLVTGDVTLEAQEIARFSRLAGRELAGGVALQIAGQVNPLGGAFDAKVAGDAQDLAFGIAELDALLQGRANLALDATRGAEGVQLRSLALNTDQLRLDANGNLSSSAAALSASGRLADVSLIAQTGLRGPAQFDAELERAGDDWQVLFKADGPQASRAEVEGLVAGTFDRADLALAGRVPLGLVNGFISPNIVDGMADASLRLTGPLALTSLQGDIRVDGATLSLPEAKIGFDTLSLAAALANGQAVITGRAGASTGGRLEIAGPIALSAPYVGDLQGRIVDFRLSDGKQFDTTLSGDWAVTGGLAAAPTVRATITLGQTDVMLAEIGAAVPAVLEGVRHVGDSAAVRRTRLAAGLGADIDGTSGAAVAYPIDLLIDAPSRLFLRGRGLDAELGGQVRLTGTTNDIVSLGRFDLIRGRLDILGKRLVLSEGYGQLRGNFDPDLFLVATTQAEGTDINVTITGTASDPNVSFTSNPDLPEDEILALLLFGRGLAKISALQALQLASAVRTLAGNDAGLLNNIRDNFGLDDLDVSTSQTGEIGARVGKYLSDNVYSDVTVGGGQASEVNLNLILTPSVTARGSVNTDGESALGLFFEREY